jgi:hypothetical protein
MKEVKHPIELMIASLAVSKPGKLFLNHAAQTIIAIQNEERAREEMILVKNQISRWTVVSLNLVSPDIATMRPMIDLSPMAKTTAVQLPWTTKVELRARLRVSSALGDVEWTVPGTMSLEVKQG